LFFLGRLEPPPGFEALEDEDGLEYSSEQIGSFVQPFPSSLESLIIKNCSEAIFNSIVALLRGDLPKDLKTIELDFLYCTPGFVKELEEIAVARGLLLSYCDAGCHEICGICEEY